jgi:hypothetical protein
VFSRVDDVTSAVCSSERRTAFLVVIRRVVLLASFLLTGFAIAACWSATASAAEGGVDEAPQPVHDRLVAIVANNAAAEAGTVDTVHELVGIAETVDRGDIPEPSRVIMDVLDAVNASTVNEVASVADMVPNASGDLVTIIDTMADHGLAYEVLDANRFQAGPDNAVIEHGWSPAEIASSAVVTDSRSVDIVVPTESSSSASTKTGAAPVDHLYGNDLSSQLPNEFPMAPLSVAGTSGGTSAVGSSGGPAAGATVPGATSHDDVFVVSGIAADSVYAVRQLALVPQVSPA